MNQTRPATILHPPLLAHDLTMHSRFGVGVSPNGKLERRIVWNLLAHLQRAGFATTAVHDGEETTAVGSPAAAMELIFNLDEARVHVSRGGRQHWILLVLGNGCDVVSDWGVPRQSDGFDEAMSAFDPEAYA